MSSVVDQKALNTEEDMFAEINGDILGKFAECSPDLKFDIRCFNSTKSTLIVTSADCNFLSKLEITVLPGNHLRVSYCKADRELDVAFFSLAGENYDIASDVEATFHPHLSGEFDKNFRLIEDAPTAISNTDVKIVCAKVLQDLQTYVPNLSFEAHANIKDVVDAKSINGAEISIRKLNKIIATLKYEYIHNMHLHVSFEYSGMSNEEDSAFFSMYNHIDDVAAHVTATFIERIANLE